jgi:hypothetical protein
MICCRYNAVDTIALLRHLRFRYLPFFCFLTTPSLRSQIDEEVIKEFRLRTVPFLAWFAQPSKKGESLKYARRFVGMIMSSTE